MGSGPCAPLIGYLISTSRRTDTSQLDFSRGGKHPQMPPCTMLVGDEGAGDKSQRILHCGLLKYTN